MIPRLDVQADSPARFRRNFQMIGGLLDRGQAGAHALQTLAEQSPVLWDLDRGGQATLTLTADRTMGPPAHPLAGMTYVLFIVQGTGGSHRITAWDAAFVWTSGAPPELKTAEGAVDVFRFACDGSKLYG